MHAGLLDVLHDAADQHVLAVAHRVHVHFDGDVEEAVEQHRAVVRHPHGVRHVGPQVLLVEHHLHGAPPEHVRGAHNERKADLARQAHRLILGAGGGVRRLLEPEIAHQYLKALDRKSTRLNSSHSQISYAVFCLKKKNTTTSYAVASWHAEKSEGGGPAAVESAAVSCVLPPDLTAGPYSIARAKLRRNITDGQP